jgi:hypothetical protein
VNDTVDSTFALPKLYRISGTGTLFGRRVPKVVVDGPARAVRGPAPKRERSILNRRAHMISRT